MLESRLAELSDRAVPQPLYVSSQSLQKQILISFLSQSITNPECISPTCIFSATLQQRKRVNSPEALTTAELTCATKRSSLPPSSVLQSIVDTFFVHVHNRPYSYIQEASFRRNLELGIVPHCLLLAVLATAVRFSTHDYYEGGKQEAIEVYAKGSWISVLTEHLTVVDNLTLEVVQTVNLLAIVDYTGRLDLLQRHHTISII